MEENIIENTFVKYMRDWPFRFQPWAFITSDIFNSGIWSYIDLKHFPAYAFLPASTNTCQEHRAHSHQWELWQCCLLQNFLPRKKWDQGSVSHCPDHIIKFGHELSACPEKILVWHGWECPRITEPKRVFGVPEIPTDFTRGGPHSEMQVPQSCQLLLCCRKTIWENRVFCSEF